MITKILKYLAGGFIFLLPFLVAPSRIEWFQIDPPKLEGMFFLGNLAFATLLYKKFGKVIALSHVLLSLTAVLTGFTAMQLEPFAYWIAGWSAALYFVEISDEKKIFFTRCLLYAILIQCILAILQVFKIDPIFTYAKGVEGHPIGFFGQATKFGWLTASLSVIALGLEEWVIFLVLAVVTILTASSFAILSLIGGVLIVLRYKIGIMPVAAIVGLGMLFATAWYAIDPGNDVFVIHQRPQTYQDTYKAWQSGSICAKFEATTEKFSNGAPKIICTQRYQRSPLIFFFGYGPGSFYELFYNHFQRDGTKMWGEFKQTHCDYLQVLFEYGFCGILLLFFGLIAILRYYWKSWIFLTREFYCYPFPPLEKTKIKIAAEAGLAALMISAIGGFPFHLAPHLLIGIICLAVLFKKD